MSALKRKIASGLAVVALAAAGAVIGTAPANAASGKASCATSNIVGIWVDVDGGTDGWATRTATSDPRVNNYSYDTQNKRWRVNVGCGGNSQVWGQTISSDWSNIQGAATITCADTGYIRTCSIG